MSEKSKKTKKSSKKDRKNSDNYVCAEIMNLSIVGEVRSSLQSMLGSGDVVIDVSAVESIDAATIQMFYSVVQFSQDSKFKVTWLKPSDPFLDAVELLGMSEHLKVS